MEERVAKLSPLKLARANNLNRLLSEDAAQKALAVAIGTPASHLSALRHARRGMGDELAAKICNHYRKPEGWLDSLISSEEIAAITGTTTSRAEPPNIRPAEPRNKVPRISWVQAGSLSEVMDFYQPGEAETWDDVFVNVGRHAFSLSVIGDSMTSPYPGDVDTFPEGTVLIVDPDTAAQANSYVIAKDVSTQQATFKKLVHDGGRWFLKPLNPAYPTIEIDDPSIRVIGKVVESFSRRKLP